MKHTLFDFQFKSSKKSKTKDGGDDDTSFLLDQDTADTARSSPREEEGGAMRADWLSSTLTVWRQSQDEESSSDRSVTDSISGHTARLSTPSSSMSTGESHTQSKSASSGRPSVKKRPFQEQWRRKWSWLKLSDSIDGGMQCELCLKHLKKNTFTTKSGGTNFRTSTLE